MLFNVDELQIHSSINQQHIAGHFGHKVLCQLCTNQFYTQLTKAHVAKTSCNQLLVHSATYLLKTNLPTKNILQIPNKSISEWLSKWHNVNSIGQWALLHDTTVYHLLHIVCIRTC